MYISFNESYSLSITAQIHERFSKPLCRKLIEYIVGNKHFVIFSLYFLCHFSVIERNVFLSFRPLSVVSFITDFSVCVEVDPTVMILKGYFESIKVLQVDLGCIHHLLVF